MNEESIKLNQLEMLDFYKKFDPISFKYKLLLEYVENENSRLETYLELQKYEEERQFAELTRKEFWDLQKNLDMAYANRKITDDFLELYDLICEKVIQNYIHIDGMERLFSEKYSEFEWEMHLAIDYEKHSMDFYRDHFIHQVKDAYSMMRLLDQEEGGGFYSKVYDMLNDEGNSKIAKYVNKLVGQQLRLPKPPAKKDSNTGYPPELLREHYIYNIIYMSSYIAGLFHDIGYPAKTALENGQRIVDYLVEMHHFEQGGYDFRQIMSLLQNSLLFRIVSPQEIHDRIGGTKVDHGVMSALLLLLHFYENGAIHRLDPYKLCAVELAALAIYNHTNDYTYIGDKNAPYERLLFHLDPISYLLRVCDDLQEWGRIYFEVSDASNIIVCNQCHMPVFRRKTGKASEGYESDYDVDYRCSCMSMDDEDGWLFAPMFRYKQFPYRRIYNVTVCREVEIRPFEGFKRYQIDIKYDLDRLLHIAYINPDYAKYRTKELAKLKCFFPRQDQIERVFLNYFVTANVILIKSVIVGQFLEKKLYYEKGKFVENVLNIILGDTQKDKLTNVDIKAVYLKIESECSALMENHENLYKVCLPKGMGEDKKINYQLKCETYFNKAFSVYVFIYLLICVGKEINTRGFFGGEELGKELEKVLEIFLRPDGKKIEPFYSEEVEVLLKDCCIQAGRMFDSLDNFQYYPDSYFSTYHSDDTLYSAVKGFIDTEKYCHLIDKKETRLQLDAYSDIYTIREMLKELMGS